MIGACAITIGVFICSFKAWPIVGNVKGKIVVATQNELRLSQIDDITGKMPAWKAILESKDEYRYPDWSPDGTRIIMGYLSWEESRPTMRGPNTFYKLVIVNADGTGLNYLHKGNENYEYPAWSPDGKFIAFMAYPNWPKERVGQLCLLNLSTKDLLRIDGQATIARPAWSFDGQMLAFTRSDFKIVLYDIGSRKERTLPIFGISPIFHPDGKRIFYIQNNEALCTVNVDGSNKRIVKKSFFDYLVKFSKDGHYLLYAGGGAIAIPPGHEYSTLEVLDMKKLRSYRVFKGSLLYGASWLE